MGTPPSGLRGSSVEEGRVERNVARSGAFTELLLRLGLGGDEIQPNTADRRTVEARSEF